MKQPRKYQQRSIDFGTSSNLLLSDQMGLGKSLTAIEICKAVFGQCNAPALIIVPKGIRLQWEQFILDQDPDALVWIINTIDDVLALSRATGIVIDYVIIHYEGLVKFIYQLAKLQWSTIIVDEAHRIKNRKAQRSISIKSLKAHRKIALTGTPFDRNPAEIWSILNWLQPKTFTSYWQFMDEHITFDVIRMGNREFPKNYRLKNPQSFAKMLTPHMLRRTKRMVMPELPPLQITRVPIELSQTQRVAYEKIKHVVDMEVNFDELSEPMFIQHALTKLVRLLQCASDPAGIGLIAPSAKLDWLQEWCADNPHEPVLIFSRYRTTAEHAAAVLGADALIMGGMALETPLISSQRIVATIGAAAVGYDLGHITTTIFIDCEWSSILMAQAMERIDRGGNTEPKNIIFLEAQNTVDQLVTLALDQKWNVKQLIDNFLTMEQNHGIISNSI